MRVDERINARERSLHLFKLDVYDGEYEDGVRQGSGIYKCIGDGVYYGELKNNEAEGRGRMKYTNGSEYCVSGKEFKEKAMELLEIVTVTIMRESGKAMKVKVEEF